ncbi:hypothetical protein [Thalassotalea agarivorans]|nr:hypothetical protein [Thalassotalea agarivorans]
MRGKDDVFENWEDCEDMQAIKQAIHMRINPKIPVLPLQYSPAFDLIIDEGKSLTWLANTSKQAKPYFKKLLRQWQDIGSAIQALLSNSS